MNREQGKFYWVLAKVSPADSTSGRPVDNDDVPTWQPARYTGKAADSVGETWDFIGYRSEDGHHFVEVIEVGKAVEP